MITGFKIWGYDLKIIVINNNLLTFIIGTSCLEYLYNIMSAKYLKHFSRCINVKLYYYIYYP